MGLAVLLTHMSPKRRLQLQREYTASFKKESWYKPLAEAICSHHWGLMEVILLGMIRPSEWVWARTLYEACCGGLIGLGTDEETLACVVVLNWHQRPELKNALVKVCKWKGKNTTLQALIDEEIEN